MDDVEEISNYFLRRFAIRYGRRDVKISQSLIEKLKMYDWPGNIRELENVIEKFTLIYDEELDIDELSELLISESSALSSSDDNTTLFDSLPVHATLEEIEKCIVQKVLMDEGYNKTRASKRLGITRATLNAKLV
jgi:transcriptional regulator with PAS, ATPase and Fis domain